MSKWKEIESYMDSKSFHESKFNIIETSTDDSRLEKR